MIKCKIIDQTDWKAAEQELQEFLNYADAVISITQSEMFTPEYGDDCHLTITVVIEVSE